MERGKEQPMRTTLFAAALGSFILLGLPPSTFAQELAMEPTFMGEGEIATTTETVLQAPSLPSETENAGSTEAAPQEHATVTSSTQPTSHPAPIEPTVSVATSSPITADGSATITTELPSRPETIVPILGETPSTTTSGLLCLAIIAPAPSEGPEWIAVYGLTPSTSASFLEWSFADAQGSLVTVNASTTLIWDEATQTMRYELRSARLNNGGDSVFLKTPTGTIHDVFTYPETERGHRWMRDGCLNAWEAWPRPIVVAAPQADMPQEETVAAETAPVIVNEALPAIDAASIPVVEPPAAEASSPATATETASHLFLAPPPARLRETAAVSAPAATPTPANGTIKKTNPTIKTASKTSSDTTASSGKAGTKATKQVASSPKKTARTAKKSSPKKAAAPKLAPLIPSIAMPHLLETPEEYQGIRVRLRGRVASQTQFLGAHTFVVVNEDGRGLLVKGTSKHPSPPFGAWVDLTGTVVWNDGGLSIKQAAADQWEARMAEGASPSDAFPTRTVDLLAPSQEEAWSRVRIEGTISAVQKTSFDLDVGDASVRVRLVPRLGYRAQRLQAGDTVAIQGLLDLRGEEPTVIPQAVEAIEIIRRAAPPAPAAKSPVEQPWLPVGAAAGTLALSEGWRRFNTYRKQRQEAASFRRFLEASGKDRD